MRKFVLSVRGSMLSTIEAFFGSLEIFFKLPSVTTKKKDNNEQYAKLKN